MRRSWLGLIPLLLASCSPAAPVASNPQTPLSHVSASPLSQVSASSPAAASPSSAATQSAEPPSSPLVPSTASPPIPPFAYPTIHPPTSPSPEPCGGPALGLLITNGTLEAIDTCGKLKASAPLAPPSARSCDSTGVKANLAPPVSATNDRIYYRDGDTKIEYLTPDGQRADATTVPGSTTSVSFFSVSPDDTRIAVVVEDLSSPNTINLRLYVEDIQGGGHHVDIFSAAVSKADGSTLWPMGWHGGQLVLAVIAACTNSAGDVSPSEWHVVDPATGNRTVTIGGMCLSGQSGILSRWPSPSGVVCADFSFKVSFRSWDGVDRGPVGGGTNSNDVQTGLSPSGKSFFFGSNTAVECGSAPSMCIYGIGTDYFGNSVVAWGELACLWIDDTHLLTPDAVLTLPVLPVQYSPGHAFVYQLQAGGTCAGRFPGGL